MELITERLILRPLQQDDGSAFLPLYNTPEVHHPKSPRVPEARQKELFRILVQQPPLLSPYIVLAIVNAMNTCIGLLFLNIHQVPKSRESLGVVGIVISNECQGKGYGTEACQATLRFLFEERRVTRVMMGCGKANLSCQRVIEKLRLQPIPISRRAALVASGWVAPDELWYELLAADKGKISP
jgi:RimJ/RimL family protein N-acetyltransferase